KDPIEAYKWLSLAAAAGDNSAGAERLKLAETMSLQDVAEGEYRTGSFRPVTGDAAGRKSQDDSPTPKSMEAGFFITADGYFLSKMHVTRDARKIMVKNKNGLLPARFIKGNIASDLAIYKVEGTFSPLPISMSSIPGRGAKVSVPKFNNDDWKAARISQQSGIVLGSLTNTMDGFQVSFAQPGENAGGCILDTMGSAIGLAAFRTFKPDQTNSVVAATSFASLKQIFSTLPTIRSALVPMGKQERKDNALEEASALLLSY
ncbi:MAG TPA: S1C family serine protease, partial [Candidatus Saccharimonadales bacterium]|nr:S1C family serine protease [Candidatus Saccharimonadales bacterium]